MSKKILQYSLLMFALILATGCSHEEVGGTENVIQQKPNWTRYHYLVETAQTPDWKVDYTDFAQSMTATITLDESILDVRNEDLIAAFVGEECVGVTNCDKRYNNSPRFYLYINEPQQSSERLITLVYYNSKTRTLRYWPRFIDYATDKILGTVSKPLVLKEDDCSFGYPDYVKFLLTLPRDICTFEPDDEIAVFVGDECRATSIDGKFGASIVSINVPVKDLKEEACIRYYSSRNHRIYVSQTFKVVDGMVNCTMTPCD